MRVTQKDRLQHTVWVKTRAYLVVSIKFWDLFLYSFHKVAKSVEKIRGHASMGGRFNIPISQCHSQLIYIVVRLRLVQRPVMYKEVS